jgi:SAM-dependent methyltransferase
MTDSSNQPPQPFDDPAYYDAMIDWPARLSREAPFFKKHFTSVGVQRVLDVACGTGQHATMFHQWGLHVEAADVSTAMVDHARRTYGQDDHLHWVQRSFTEPPPSPAAFDAVVCLGNSLALAGDAHLRAKACAAMLNAVRPGGLCIIQVLNLWRLPEGPTQWPKCLRVALAGRDHILLKAVHRTGDRGFVDLVDLQLDATGGLERRFENASFDGIEAAELVGQLTASGAAQVAFYGDYANSPYRRAASTDLIAVTVKQQSA